MRKPSLLFLGLCLVDVTLILMTPFLFAFATFLDGTVPGGCPDGFFGAPVMCKEAWIASGLAIACTVAAVVLARFLLKGPTVRRGGGVHRGYGKKSLQGWT